MVYDHDVVYGSVGGGADAVDALAHQIAMVLGGDDDGDARSLLEGIAGFKEIERFPAPTVPSTSQRCRWRCNTAVEAVITSLARS